MTSPGFLRHIFSKNIKLENTNPETTRQILQRLINDLEQVVFQIDVLGRWTFLNNSWETLTGFPVSNCLGENYLNYIHPNDRDVCNQSLIGLLNQEKSSFHIRVRFLSKDENFFWADIHANKTGNDNSHIVGCFANVTDQAHEAGLSYATHRSLMTLIDNLNGLVYRGRNDHSWSMEFVSAGCYKLTGYQAEEFTKKSVSFASLIHVDDRENVWNEVQSALNDRSIIELIYRIKTREGKEKWVWETAQGHLSSSGELLGLEGFITDITSWKKSYQRTLHDSLYVGDTDFPRQRLFMDRLKCSINRSREIDNFKFILFMIQIDRFNSIKGRFNDESCEKLLTQVGELLYKETEPLNTVCLLKEDVFGILLEHAGSLREINECVQRFHNIFTQPLEIDGSSIFLTISIGIAVNSDDYENPNAVIRDANTALLRAKVLGGACHEIFDERLNIKVSSLYRMEKEFYDALANQEIELVFQPFISSRDNRFAGLEIMPVWLHPRKGKLNLDNFISMAHNAGLTLQLNKYILVTLCEKLSEWSNLNESCASLVINIRLFDAHLSKQQFVETLDRKIFTQLADRQRFYFLISSAEGAVLQNNDNNSDFFETLDDFKTKTCLELDLYDTINTALLTNPYIEIIKLNYPADNQSPDQHQLISATIDFLHGLGKTIILSGSDTDSLLSEIALEKCDFFQENSIEKTIDADSMEDLLNQYKTDNPFSNPK